MKYFVVMNPPDGIPVIVDFGTSMMKIISRTVDNSLQHPDALFVISDSINTIYVVKEGKIFMRVSTSPLPLALKAAFLMYDGIRYEQVGIDP